MLLKMIKWCIISFFLCSEGITKWEVVLPALCLPGDGSFCRADSCRMESLSFTYLSLQDIFRAQPSLPLLSVSNNLHICWFLFQYVKMLSQLHTLFSHVSQVKSSHIENSYCLSCQIKILPCLKV